MTHTNGFRACATDRIALLRSPSCGRGLRDTLVALLNGSALLPFDVVEHGLARLATWSGSGTNYCGHHDSINVSQFYCFVERR